MIKFIFLVLSISFWEVYGKIEVQECADHLDKTLKYLEGRKHVNENASMMMAWGASEIMNTLVTVPKLPPGRADMVNGFVKRFLPFARHAGDGIDSPFVKQLLSYPEFWGHEMEFKYIPGRVKIGQPLAASMEEIVKRSLPTEEDGNCIVGLLDDNKASLTPRECKMTCKDKMYDASNPNAGMPPDEKLVYIIYEALLNCTNTPIDGRAKAVAHHCEYLMSEILTLDTMLPEDKFKLYKYFYLNKLLICGTYGFPEFFEESRMRGLMKSINPDGSIGLKENKQEDIDVMTAQVSTIFAGCIRMLSEHGQ